MYKIRQILVLIVFGCMVSKVSAGERYHYQPVIDIKPLFQQAIKDRAFPGGCIVAGTRDQVLIKKCFGYHTYNKGSPQGVDDLFDLASLTKVIGTTTAIMKLQEQRKLKLSDKVVQYLPEFSGPDQLHNTLKKTITIADLLRHRSGLRECQSIDKSHDAPLNQRWYCLFKTPLKYYPRQKVEYLDLNFIILGKIVERITRERLDQFLNRNVFEPLAMSNTAFNPDSRHSRIVPTCSEISAGIVHDPIARYLEGVSGHAGLFSTVTDLQHYAQMILNEGVYNNARFLQPDTIAFFTVRDPLLAQSTRALGWDTAYNPSESKVPHQFTAGHYIDADAIGHTGYTGTSLWISPKQGLYVILLTNRVFENSASAHQQRHRYWRQKITSAVWRNCGFTRQNALYREPLNR